MWCYQKPGFQALLLTELQRQQQCRHSCDTMLTTEDISVPAHSCVLSAISPHIASTLSSTPSPPPGQSRLLEFQALGACTLLRVVGLMYSGEMVGEGETEKQEAVSAAAKLGIHGLVEVTTKTGENSQWVEVGVQTEPLEKEKGQVRWVRDVRDGSTIMWKERLSGGNKDMWTQTEQLQLNTVAPELTFETIDMSCLQNLSHAHSSAIPPQIPFIPISLLYPPNEHPNPPPSCAPVASSQESTAAGASSAGLDPPPSFSSLFSREITSFVHPQSRRSSSQAAAAAAANEWDDSSFEQFKGNIPGYINDFLNPERQKRRRGRPRGRSRNSGAGGTRRARAGERLRQRLGRGGFTETVDVQEVGLSTVHKVFLQRWSTRSPRTGQGGGAAGRKLYLKTREQLPKRRGGGPEKTGKVSLNKREPPSRAATQDEVPLSSAKERPADGFQSPPSQFCNRRTAPASTPSLQPSPSPGLRSSTGSYASPASSFLHNAAAPPPPPPPQDEQVEQIDRLLEEVMMGLDIFPNSGAQPAPPAGSGGCTYAVSSSAESRQHGGRSGTATGRGAAPQPRGEAELGDMLDNFLSTFEREIRGCNPAGEERVGRGQTRASAGSSQAATQPLARSKTPISSRLRKASASNAARSQRAESRKKSDSQKPRKRRRRKEQKPSQQTLKDLVVPSEPIIRKLENQQLRQMPVVKLGRRGPLPDRMILRGKGLPDLNGNSKIGKIESSCGRCASEAKSQSMWTGKKMYPIRSKLKDACADGSLVLEQPLKQHRRVRRCRSGGPQNGSVLDLSGNVRPAEPLQEASDESEGDATSVQPQEHAREAPRQVSRRRAEVEEQKSEDASGSKRLRLGQPSHTATPVTPRPRDLREAEEVIDVETLSPSGSPEGSQEDKPEWRQRSGGEPDGDSCDEIIVVDGDEEDEDFDPLGGSGLVTHPTSVPGSESLKYQGEEEEEEEEEIDVVSD